MRTLTFADTKAMSRPRAPGVRTARKLLVGFGIGVAFIAVCSIGALLALNHLNAIVRHLAYDPVPGAAAIARFANDFNQYRVLEVSSPSSKGPRDAALDLKAADIRRDLKAYDGTITQDTDRRQFGELVALWGNYADLDGAVAAQGVSEKIDALLVDMIEWNRLEGIRSIERADSATRAASVTVLSMLVAALLLSALALYFNRTVERPMNALAETAHAVAHGNLDVRAPVSGPLEVATVAAELNRMLDARAQADAEARVLNAAIEESRGQLQRLTAGLLMAREEERTRIAREIHDTLGQSLTALKMDVGWIGRRLPDDTPATLAKLAAMTALIDETVVTVRRIATELRPGVLDDLGLVAALEWQAQEFEHRTGISCALRASVDDIEADPLLSTAVFRIFQESLTNIARHSGASRVAVTLEHLDPDLILEVHDNGVGIAQADASSGRSIGLVGMRERALLVGGDFSISGAAGAGTAVRVRIPWRGRAEA
jgi:signal transduction histidine kinase